MNSHNLDTKIKLIEIGKEIQKLTLLINDSEFTSDPARCKRELIVVIGEKRKEHSKKIKEYENILHAHQEALSEYNKYIANPEKVSESLVDKLNKNLVYLDHKLEDVDFETEKLKKEIDESNDRLELILHDENYKRYFELYMQSINLKESAGEDQSEALDSIKLLADETSGGKINLKDIFINQLKSKNSWYENFEKRLHFILTDKNPKGVYTIEFENAKGHKIEITRDSVRSETPLTKENMREIVPAMAALFLKCTENTNTKGCIISEEDAEVLKFMEDLLAKELFKRSSDNYNYRINNKTVADLLNESSKNEANENKEPAKATHEEAQADPNNSNHL